MTRTKFTIDEGHTAALSLTRAILVYQGGGSSFATVHNVARGDTGPLILAGKPLTPAVATRLARELAKAAARGGGFMPQTLLYLDGDVLAWWVPPCHRHVAFRAKQLGADERGEVVPHPGLVFCVTGRRAWYVWAVVGAERPAPDTPLYRSPYFNVWDDGAICTGNVGLPQGTTAEKVEAWNASFFGSFFTHPNGNGVLVSYRGGPYKLWRDLLDGRFTEFPQRVLKPTGHTLAQTLSQIK
jgi:PRTRC genetic system protein B